MMLRTVCGVLVAGGGSVWWACLDVFVSLCVCAERLCVSVGAVGDRRYESDVAHKFRNRPWTEERLTFRRFSRRGER